jgi:hypothetical protein|tara:strand:- start:1867 stop:2679 length:813 start_codon:yes stop_codon:yes gene_type:complete
MKLDIIVRIHDGKNIHGGKPRYINIPKKDLIIGCLSSLIHSANLSNEDISFVILNDHCTENCISKVKKIFEHSKHSYQIKNLEISGFNYSGLMQFNYCRNSTADLVYSVEDDYLHCKNAISEMLSSYMYLKSSYNLQKELCIFPFDNPEDYVPHQIYSGRVFRTPTRHWREGIWTTFTMMTTPKVFRDHWNIFEKLALHYKPYTPGENLDNFVDEQNTIGKIWRNNVTRINPIPSLALHIQFEEQRDPFINHIEWWNKYSKINQLEINYG